VGSCQARSVPSALASRVIASRVVWSLMRSGSQAQAMQAALTSALAQTADRVFALWSAPRARSTAFFRSMVERGDMTVLHEPFCNLRDYGETDAGARTFDSPLSLLAWLDDETALRTAFGRYGMGSRGEFLACQR
jgi:hypothetical protein